jgi:SWIM zinc finger
LAKRWNVDQVLALAPDPASRKAGRGLASSPRWSQLGSNESLVWGRFQGSAKEPYQVTVDVAEPAFRCTCPSRKVPCKHGLGLLVMWAKGNGSIADGAEVAPFAGEWAAQRADRLQRPRTGRRSEAPADPEAQAKRLAAKIATMSAGMDDFDRWLSDIVRQGLAEARRQPFAFWDNAAGRLVDAQLPGLAEQVRVAAGTIHARSDWADYLLGELGRWYLAVRAWRRLAPSAAAGSEAADDQLTANLRVMIGWSRPTQEVLEKGQRIKDRWTVVGRRLGGDATLQSQRTWLAGQESGEIVVLLDFAAAGAALPVAQVVGTVVDAELALYPGGRPRRALMIGEHSLVGKAAALPAVPDLHGALDKLADALAQNPWARRCPVGLANAVTVMEQDGRAWVVDTNHAAVRLGVDADPWSLLALTGGQPADLFGELEEDSFHPTTVAVGGHLVSL